MQRTRARAPVRPRRNYAAVLRLRAELSLRPAVNQTPCVKGTALPLMQALALRLGPIARLCFRPASRVYGPVSGLARRARTLLQTPPPATFRLMPRASLRCSGACRGAHASQGKFPVEHLWERPNSVTALCGKKPVSASVQCAEAYGGIFY